LQLSHRLLPGSFKLALNATQEKLAYGPYYHIYVSMQISLRLSACDASPNEGTTRRLGLSITTSSKPSRVHEFSAKFLYRNNFARFGASYGGGHHRGY
jgi:hypothetical protein